MNFIPGKPFWVTTMSVEGERNIFEYQLDRDAQLDSMTMAFTEKILFNISVSKNI